MRQPRDAARGRDAFKGMLRASRASRDVSTALHTRGATLPANTVPTIPGGHTGTLKQAHSAPEPALNMHAKHARTVALGGQLTRRDGGGGGCGDGLDVGGASDADGEGCPPVAVGPVRERARGGDDRLLSPVRR